MYTRRRLAPALTPPSTSAATNRRRCPGPRRPRRRTAGAGRRACAPVRRRLASRPATVTAAVPWMSSLKEHVRFGSARAACSAFSLRKSSHCSTAPGNTRHGVDELVDEGLVAVAAHALVAQAEVERVRRQFLVVRADVEHDRHRALRRQACAQRVQRELADRDAHAAGALVTQAQDALAVGDDDHRWDRDG
jgi:hypothetical protein